MEQDDTEKRIEELERQLAQQKRLAELERQLANTDAEADSGRAADLLSSRQVAPPPHKEGRRVWVAIVGTFALIPLVLLVFLPGWLLESMAPSTVSWTRWIVCGDGSYHLTFKTVRTMTVMTRSSSTTVQCVSGNHAFTVNEFTIVILQVVLVAVVEIGLVAAGLLLARLRWGDGQLTTRNERLFSLLLLSISIFAAACLALAILGN
ncbi:hypothetical protein BOO86_00360 [Mycobacterium sp. CBMA 234]|uniref:hypothetical protein n=1 Tax=Mycolicibacterium sp. CBMA 234 TaxID=1918495 RepID=UPI0012DC3282|nr:hypothetical protein [Mycolicibacterium sp. CBMA 234]MUL62898.1 hypothetical protein [Mycolicibacterium sp. CBMA 234]